MYECKTTQTKGGSCIDRCNVGSQRFASDGSASWFPVQKRRGKSDVSGRGGKWDQEIASKSTASKSSAKVASWSNAGPIDKIERTYIIDRSKDSEWVDDEGNSFVNLEYTKEFENGGDWDRLNDSYKDEGWKIAWYSTDNVYITDKTQLYNGAELRANWISPEIKDPVIDTEQFNEEDIVVTGLEPGEQLIVKDIEADAETEAKRMEELDKALANREGKSALQVYGSRDEIIKLDIDVANYKHDSERRVVITLPVPEDFLDDKYDVPGGYVVKAVHFKEDGKVEVLNVNIDDGHQYMTIVVKNGFSPFYLVKAEGKQDPATVKVLIENVDNGVVQAYTQERNEGSYQYAKKYLPIDEEVELPYGTEIQLQADEYYFSESDWQGDFKSMSLIPVNGEEEGEPEVLIPSQEGKENKQTWANVKVTQDCRIRAEFGQEPIKYDDENAMFSISLRPSWIDGPAAEGEYTAEVRVRKYNADEDHYENFSGWTIREATMEELLEAKVNQSYIENNLKEGMDALEYNADDNTVTNVNPLMLGEYYRIPFVITYEGQEYLLREEGENDNYPYTGYVSVGASVYYRHGLVTFGDQYDTSDGTAYFGYRDVVYDENMTWNEVEPSDEFMAEEFYGGRPQMYNYEFVGWQDYTGAKYEADSKLVPHNEGSWSFYVYDLFENEEGKKYAVEAKGAEDSKPENPENPDDPNKPDDSNKPGYRPGSGGGSGSSTRDYAMHGTWIADGNTWKFRKDSGEYAANTWGLINGKWYYFDAQGNMVTGWYQVGGQWYYMNPAVGANQGVMMTGWILDPAYNAWFYLNASGAMTTGWQQVNGAWYYLNPVSDGTKGAMAANTTIDGYYVNADGAWVQ